VFYALFSADISVVSLHLLSTVFRDNIDMHYWCVISAASSTAGSSTNAPPSSTANKDMLDNVRKCKNFLSTLLKLASNQPATTVQNVKTLIQGLVVGFMFFLQSDTCAALHVTWLLGYCVSYLVNHSKQIYIARELKASFGNNYVCCSW